MQEAFRHSRMPLLIRLEQLGQSNERQQNRGLNANDCLHHGGANPAKLVVLDTDTAKFITSVEGVEGVGHTDDLWYDGAHKRIYMSGGMPRSAFLSSVTWIIMPL